MAQENGHHLHDGCPRHPVVRVEQHGSDVFAAADAMDEYSIGRGRLILDWPRAQKGVFDCLEDA